VEPEAAPVSGALLEVRDLATHFFTRAGVLKAVDGVSFSLAPGQTLGLVGESGSGKTLTGFSILGLVEPPGRIVRGSVRFEGRELVGMDPRELRAIRGRRLAMVFQDPMMTLNPVLSVEKQMRLALEAHQRMPREAARSRCVRALELVGIPDAEQRLGAYPHEFSGGMRQRVAIAMALLHRPALIIADEPTTALDVSIQAQILAGMAALVREMNLSLIWISHDLATVSGIADRTAVMYAGRIVEEGPTAEVLAFPRHPYTRGLLDSLPANAEPGRPLAHIAGAMPPLLGLGEGCAFAARCARADAACERAPDATTAGGRSLRCHHPLERVA
jgi:peptide/nickel transport system ATP-binding protein